jgi:hypothetical protein
VVGVGDGDGEGVGGVGAGDGNARQKAGDHGVDLHFFGGAGADHRFLDEAGCILTDLHPGTRGAKQDDTSGLAELQGRLRILVDEHFFDRGPVRVAVGDQRLELGGEMREAGGQRFLAVSLELAVGDVAEAISVRFDQSPAGRAQSGIETEDDQASLSSSSSEMS